MWSYIQWTHRKSDALAEGDELDTKLDKYLRDVESAVGRLRAHVTAIASQAAGVPGTGKTHRGGRLLAAIDERGGEVTTEEFYRLGMECGYDDLRGLGGFFNGEQRSIVEDPKTGSRKLTQSGKGQAAAWRKMYGATGLS
jgi:hypothetical protein